MYEYSAEDASSNGMGRARVNLALLAAIMLVTLSTAQIGYRYTLPTDGWSVYTTELDQPNWVYWRNMVGAPSDIKLNDELLAVQGVALAGTASLDPLPAPPRWAVGQTVEVVVLRSGQEVTVEVPVVHWTPAGIWRYIALPESVVSLLGGIILGIVGFFTYSRRPDLPSARALLILCAAIAATTISGLVPQGLSTTFNRLAHALTGFFSYSIFGIVLAPSLLTFSLHFPRTKQAILRHRWLGYIPVAIGLIIAIAVYAGENTAIVGWLGTMAMVVTSIASLVHSGVTQRDAVSRAQLRWAIGGFAIGLALFLAVFPTAFGWITNDFWASLLGTGPSVGSTVIGVSLAIAVLRYRLFDIDVIIRRTLIYTIVTALLTLVFFGGVALLQSLFSAVTAERSELAVVISTLMIAALFTPLRSRVQQAVDRVFYRRKYDAERTLEAFAAQLRDEMDLKTITGSLVEIVDKTIQPEWISIWVNPLPREK